MSQFKRLLPAPPPIENAWISNQLIDIKQEEDNVDVEVELVQEQEQPSLDQSKLKLKSLNKTYYKNTIKSSNSSQIETQPDSPEELVSVGKNIKIKKPKFPKNRSNDHYSNYQHQNNIPIILNSPQLPELPHPIPIPIYNPMPSLLLSPQSEPENEFEPVISPSKKNLIKKQLEYYFSIENLCKDLYLRFKLMNKIDGSIDLKMLINFNKIKRLTNNGQNFKILIEVIKTIPFLKLINDDNAVIFDDWEKWIIK
ncbi:unnamed protein product [Candida verbasci]|uniref:HTH La-type RNA-binding domain-containing protein n=1 Tax=Candida verbasci TaxID=1227364 RepID=A0A9W4TVJ3_9ASCO|nr:unnamed protein product [Candida verbasci]